MRTHALALVLALTGCDDTIFGGKEGGGGDSGGSLDGFCGVRAIFNDQCTSCHGAGAVGGLDLETDAYAALVDVPSANYDGRTLVVPGDPDASFLYLKVIGDMASDEGNAMPTSAGLAADDAETIRVWIADGASSECGEPDTGGGGDYHPPGWADPAEHGLATKLQEDACTSCHGEDLTGGGVEVSCDSCHASYSEDWRTDCTFCHGGEDNGTGAPPVYIDGSSSGAAFSVHTAHVTTNLHEAYDCTQCHSKPGDVLSSGHLFTGDSTPAVAEADFSEGLSSRASWDGAGTCSDSYCHGNGQGHNGTAEVGTDETGCASCHAGPSSGESAWDRMSGEHADHLEEGVDCAECHADTVSGTTTILDPALHVNGTANVVFSGTVTRSGGECTGSCHGEGHSAEDWD